MQLVWDLLTTLMSSGSAFIPQKVVTVVDLGGIQGCERTPLWTLVNYYS